MLFLLVGFQSAAVAQSGFPILLTTSVIPPIDADLSVWERNPDRVRITLQNTDASSGYTVRIGGFVENLDGSVRVEIDDDYVGLVTIDLAPGQTRVLSLRQTGLLNPNAVDIEGADADQISRTKRLPEGQYRICFQALDAETRNPLSLGEPSGCGIFSILEPELPRLITPICDPDYPTEVIATPTQSVFFQWTPPTNVPPGTNIRYKFAIVELPPGFDGNVEEALASATIPPFLLKEGLVIPSYQLTPIDPLLVPGTSYAWAVQVYDLSEQVEFPNDGISIACSFTYVDSRLQEDEEDGDDLSDEEEDEEEKDGEEDEGGEDEDGDCGLPTPTAHFPAQSAAATPVVRYPYRNVPFIVALDNFCKDLTSVASNLNVFDVTGGGRGTVAGSNWNRRLDDVTRATPPAGAAAQQLFYLFASPPKSNALTTLPPGRALEWEAQITVAGEKEEPANTTLGGRFEVGLGAPVPVAPADDAALGGDTISFSFQPMALPRTTELRPGLLAPLLSHPDHRPDTVGRVEEVWMLEVSTRPFTDAYDQVYRKAGKFSTTIPLLQGGALPAGLRQTITDRAAISGLTEGSTYYWRVKWLVKNQSLPTFPNRLDAVLNDTVAYAWSPVREFTRSTTPSTGGTGTGCLTVRPNSPTNGGVWQESRRPAFAVSIDQAIDPAKITGGRLDVWELVENDEKKDPAVAAKKKPTKSWSFRDGKFLKGRTGAGGAQEIYDLQLDQPLLGDPEDQFAWRLTIEHGGSTGSVRTDGTNCSSDSTQSKIGSFTIRPDMPSVSSEQCVVLAPEGPAHNAKIASANPVFSVLATPPIRTEAVDSVRLKVWKRKSATESTSSAVGRKPVFEHVHRFSGASDTNFLQNITNEGDLSSLLKLGGVNPSSPSFSGGQIFTAKIDSSYVWQVEIVTKKPRAGLGIRADGNDCDAGGRTFRSGYAAFRYDTSNVDPLAPCPDSCSIEGPTDQVPGTAPLRNGDSVKVGRFMLELTKVSDGAPGNLSGEGTIRIGWLRNLPVAVEFSGLQVNRANTVFAGEVKAKQEEGVAGLTDALTSSSASQEKILAGFGVASAASRMFTMVAGGEAMSMPIGYDATAGDGGSRSDGAAGLAVGIMSMTFTPEQATLSAVARVPVPAMGGENGIGFGVSNVCFTPQSFTSGAEKRLTLAADLGFTKEGEWGVKVLKASAGGDDNSGTWLTLDCHGLAAFNVAVAVDFPRDWVVPIDEDGSVVTDANELVTATASASWKRTTNARGLTKARAGLPPASSAQVASNGSKGNFILTGSIERFAPASAPDLQIEVGGIAIDFSEVSNPDGLSFPSGFTGDQSDLWKGVYLHDALVRLPKAITHRDSAEKALGIVVDYAILDRSGISVRGSVENPLTLEQGSAAGWGIAVDEVSLEVASNKFMKLEMEGQVKVPVMGDPIDYAAALSYQPTPTTGAPVGTTTSGTPPRHPHFTLKLEAKGGVDVPALHSKLDLSGTVTVDITKKMVTPSARSSRSSSRTTPSGPQLKWVATASIDAGVMLSGDGKGGASQANDHPEKHGDAPEATIGGIGVQGLSFQSVSPMVLNRGTWWIGEKPTAGEVTPEESSTTASTTPATSPSTPAPTPSGSRSTGKTKQSAFAKFPITISGIEALSESVGEKELLGIAFDVNIALLPDGPKGFKSTTRLGVYAAVDAEKQDLSYDHFEVKQIEVKGQLEPVADLVGAIVFYKDDPTYGNGFYGKLDVTLVKKIHAEMIGQFGTKQKSDGSTFRYGMFDFAARFNPGIALGTTGVSFYGGGGGFWLSMKREGNDPNPTAGMSETAGSEPPVSDPTQAKSTPSVSADDLVVGTSLSGYRYVPDDATKFGARLMVTLGTADPNAFNGDVALEIEVTDDWGLGRVSLNGKGYGMMTGFPGGRDQAKLKATVDLTYLPPSKTFDGRFDFDLKHGGTADPLIEVTGDVAFHVDPQSWYLKFGTPTKRISAKIRNLAEVGAYLQIGSDLDPMADVPEDIYQGLIANGVDVSSLKSRGESAKIDHGKGIVLGAKATFNTGEQKFLMFYGHINATAGFDAALLKHSAAEACGTIQPIGVDGWYGNIQMYAGMDADIGIKASTFMGSVHTSIFSAKAYALLKAGGPNPTWAAGAVAGNYSVLSGLLHGKFKFEFDVGNRCDQPVMDLDKLPMITDISPSDNLKDVNTAINPKAAFAMPVGKEFDGKLDGKVGRYRVVLDEFSLAPDNRRMWVFGLTTGSIGTTITGPTDFEIQSGGEESLLVPHDMLEGNQKYRALVRVKLQKKEGNTWRDVDGKSEELVHDFTTGPRPDHIRPEDVAFTTPYTGRRFVHGDEYAGTHGIWVTKGYGYLFREGRAEVIVSTTENPSGTPVPATYHDDGFAYSSRGVRGRVSFTPPSGAVGGGTVVSLRLLNVQEAAGQERAADSGAASMHSSDGGAVQVNRTVRQLDDQHAVGAREHELYSFFYGTSSYRSAEHFLATAPNDGLLRVEPHGFWIKEFKTGNHPGVEFHVSPSPGRVGGFDVFDVNGAPFSAGGRQHSLAPTYDVSYVRDGGGSYADCISTRISDTHWRLSNKNHHIKKYWLGCDRCAADEDVNWLDHKSKRGHFNAKVVSWRDGMKVVESRNAVNHNLNKGAGSSPLPLMTSSHESHQGNSHGYRPAPIAYSHPDYLGVHWSLTYPCMPWKDSEGNVRFVMKAAGSGAVLINRRLQVRDWRNESRRDFSGWRIDDEIVE